jgi:hypothetical protein
MWSGASNSSVSAPGRQRFGYWADSLFVRLRRAALSGFRYRETRGGLAGALQNQSARDGSGKGGQADLTLDSPTQALHHSFRPRAALPPAVEMKHQAEIRQPQKQKKHRVSSTHAFDTTDG